jgi:hypothetical protein
LLKIFRFFFYKQIRLEEMPAGQTPMTVTIVAYNDLVDAVHLGDRYVDEYQELIGNLLF